MATVLPSRLARLRARLEPITAMPTTPMFACASPVSATVVLLRIVRGLCVSRLARRRHPSPSRSKSGAECVAPDVVVEGALKFGCAGDLLDARADGLAAGVVGMDDGADHRYIDEMVGLVERDE